MMSFTRSAFLVAATLLMTACGSGTVDESAFPFPTEQVSDETLQSSYQMLEHDLSPLPAYHFRMQVPNGWKTLDTALTEEPEKDQPADVAVFRQAGPWMSDPLAPINGEIAVSVVNVSGSTLSPAAWLEGVLQKNAKGYTLIKKRVVPSSHGDMSDVLITYTSGGETLVSRMMAMRSGDKMFIVTGSDTAAEYANTADAFNVAISTFRLINPAVK
ncbi:hypothetical protein K8942_02745 [Candidatus Peribacteria bacterium]|nr:MAG: hypothetical protein K8942_02745 [Candidatus Peribacteria bacterium]